MDNTKLDNDMRNYFLPITQIKEKSEQPFCIILPQISGIILFHGFRIYFDSTAKT